MEKVRLRGGIITGRDHTIRKKNCQDGYCFEEVNIDNQNYWLGVVADGCSEGLKSEFVASVLPVYVVQQIKYLLSLGIPLPQIPISLYPHVIGFLDGLRKLISFGNMSEFVKFVKDYLLSTLIIFIIGERDFVVFHAGDGFIVINEKIIHIEHENKSPYIGYHLVPRSSLKEGASELPKNFTIERFKRFRVNKIKRLAISTDGFSEDLLRRLWQEAADVFLGIQLWMNKINGPRNDNPEAGLFYDDASVVVFERLKGGEE